MDVRAARQRALGTGLLGDSRRLVSVAHGGGEPPPHELQEILPGDGSFRGHVREVERLLLDVSCREAASR